MHKLIIVFIATALSITGCTLTVNKPGLMKNTNNEFSTDGEGYVQYITEDTNVCLFISKYEKGGFVDGVGNSTLNSEQQSQIREYIVDVTHEKLTKLAGDDLPYEVTAEGVWVFYGALMARLNQKEMDRDKFVALHSREMCKIDRFDDILEFLPTLLMEKVVVPYLNKKREYDAEQK